MSHTTVVNPSSGAQLAVHVYLPEADAEALPAMVLVPGGFGDSSLFEESQPNAAQLADRGFAVITFDPDGRGDSTGVEDYGGRVHQDGFAAVAAFAASGVPEADPDHVAVFTNSYGDTFVSGALARHGDLALAFWIDWEGPADRTDTGGCDPQAQGGHLESYSGGCDNETFWAEREALTFMPEVPIPYQRLQSFDDHVQPDHLSATKMVSAAVNGTSPWVRLNWEEPNRTYADGAEAAWLDDANDHAQAQLVAEFAADLLVVTQSVEEGDDAGDDVGATPDGATASCSLGHPSRGPVVFWPGLLAFVLVGLRRATTAPAEAQRLR